MIIARFRLATADGQGGLATAMAAVIVARWGNEAILNVSLEMYWLVMARMLPKSCIRLRLMRTLCRGGCLVRMV